MKDFFIAIQGAAKNACLGVCLADGTVIELISVGPLATKINTDFTASLKRAFDQLAKKLQLGTVADLITRTESLAIAMSGVFLSSDDFGLIQNVREVGFLVKPVVCEDVWAALAAQGHDEGAVVMISTGANVFIRNYTETAVNVSGWGSDIADQGSGYHVGIMAIRRVLQHMDGRRPVSAAFVSTVLQSLDLSLPIQLVPWYHEVRRTSYWRSKVADLAITIVKLAEEDQEPDAQKLLLHGVEEVLQSIRAGFAEAEKKKILPRGGSFPVILAGGLAKASLTYRSKIESLISLLSEQLHKKQELRLFLCMEQFHPIAGALAFSVSKSKRLPAETIWKQLQSKTRYM